jgi:hypothetical protein
MLKPYDQIFKKKGLETDFEHLDLAIGITINDQTVVSALSQVFSDSLKKVNILKSKSKNSLKDLPSFFSREILSKVDFRFYLKTQDDWEAAFKYAEKIVEIIVDKDLFERDETQQEKVEKLK